MSRYIVFETYLEKSSIKGDLPDLKYLFISNDSDIGYHYSLTNNIDNAYIFDEKQLDKAKFIAECWKMNIKKLNEI